MAVCTSSEVNVLINFSVVGVVVGDGGGVAVGLPGAGVEATGDPGGAGEGDAGERFLSSRNGVAVALMDGDGEGDCATAVVTKEAQIKAGQINRDIEE